MRRLRAFLDLTRIVPNQIMLGVGVIIGEIISFHGLPPLRLMALGFLGPFFLGASTFAMNDYFDVEADRTGGRQDRPLVRGEISANEAKWTFILGFPLGLLLSSIINLECLLMAIIFASLAVAYNLKMKQMGLPGNMFIASTMAIPFIFGSLAVGGGLPLAVVVLALISFLAGLGREVLKDVMDYEADAVRDSRSLARVRGIRTATRVSASLLLFAVGLSPIPFLVKEAGSFYHNLAYLIPVAITDIILIYCVLRMIPLNKPQEASPLRRFTLMALLIGLIGFLLGSF